MNYQVPNMLFALPEMVMLAMACVVLLFVAFTGNKKINWSYGLSQLSLFLVLLTVMLSWGESGTTFSDTYVKDALSDILKVAICLINMCVLLYSVEYLRVRQLLQGEFYVLALFATLGMFIMVSANHFLTLYLGLELLSLCLYAMVAMHRDSVMATEAAMKYFILGAIASGMLLYGMSIIYGITGSLMLQEVATAIYASSSSDTILSFALVFVIIGIGFKFGAAPFHMWLPDVYHGAPTAMTLFIAAAPKVAAFALLIRLLVDGLIDLQTYWQPMLMLMAVLSMIIGNLVAIAQTNIKRMLAYSTISHVGFLLMGVLSGTEAGYAASLFYTLIYALMTLATFGVVLLMSRYGFEADNIDDYKGLSSQHPWLALLMMVLMFSMAGIPPLAGFYAKLGVIKAVVDADMLAVALVAVVMSVIGAFYYLRVIKVMYFDKTDETYAFNYSGSAAFVLSINALLVLVLGIFPGLLMSICSTVFS
ncbi:MAG: NADH-quinone oxidoreductase subunit NuoN [Methylophaga sp.]|uniref:NADH-quinone oxidoreductase subunit NuoN n=1 Tax=Methylophaga sp. UBA678 TaxID=1946901 RepID=UPI000C5A943F|nr:NADH-quinone oxidoreductase subunit NuoN [Methylophaga sp. UBA678]MAX52620.1 NADH-quinone oxidoreductase subunit NuoN [Methylophaga sp.]|tara:strand:+ start:2849 stop:4282 length:1434 start_codon:yes stop_codon:yes gene_type:complete